MTDKHDDIPPEAGLGDVTDAELQATLQMHADAMLSQTVGMLGMLAPHIDEQTAMELAMACVQDQLGPVSQQILPSFITQEAVASHPTIILRVKRAGEELTVDVKANKRFERISDPGAAVHAALVLAFLTSPAARAVLKAFGWEFRFLASPEHVGGSIILQS